MADTNTDYAVKKFIDIIVLAAAGAIATGVIGGSLLTLVGAI